MLGAIFGTNASQAQQNFQQCFPLIRTILAKRSLLLAREFDLANWKETVGQEQEIYLDATELPIQRPKNQPEQKNVFSGKKKTYAKKYCDVA